MQNLTGFPRGHLTREYIEGLLTGPSPRVSSGIRLLDKRDVLITDLSDDLVGGSVTRDNNAKIPGSMRCELSHSIRWGVERLQPYIQLSDDSFGPPGAVFYLGVFIPTTPVEQYGKHPRTYDIQAYDKTYLLDRLIGDTWVAPAGTTYFNEITRALKAAGENNILIDRAAQSKTIPTDRVWPLVAPREQARNAPKRDNATWLQVVNELLQAIGYQGIWYDELGAARSGPHIPAASRPIEFVFSADSVRRIVSQEVQVTTDRFSAPNSWKFIRKNNTTGAAAYVFTFKNQSDGPSSIDAIGGIERWHVEFVDVESNPELDAYAHRVIGGHRREETLISLNTGPFPAVGHKDVYQYEDSRHPRGGARVIARSWRVDLGTDDTTHQWEEVPHE